jgi:electron transport complex protein RnfB
MAAEKIYRKLQQQLDLYSVGFPSTDSGIEIQILKTLFNEQQANMFLNLNPIMENISAIAQRINQSEKEVGPLLEEMASKGLVFRLEKKGQIKYGAIPFVHGLFEFQVKRLGKEMANLVEEYYNSGFKDSMAKNAAGFLRVIPVKKSIVTTQNIAAFDDAVEILKSKPLIVITDCICRKQRQILDMGCNKHLEACFMFGSMAQYYLDHDMGRQITLEEGIEILALAQKQGLVTQPATSQNPGGMCNCCGDCCGVLSSLNSTDKPANLVFSNHTAIVEKENCTGCEICIDRCQMNAIHMDDEGCAEINDDRCIGCGLCITTCPSDALILNRKLAEKTKMPPATSAEQMMALAQKRGVI